MKNLLILLTLIVSFSGVAQLRVVETQKDSVLWQATKLSSVPKIMVYTIDSVHVYTIFYKNAKYTQITDIESIGTGELETTKQFYEICKQAHIEDKEFMIEMDGENIYIKKSMGSVMIWTSTSYFYLTKKNIEDILAKLE